MRKSAERQCSAPTSKRSSVPSSSRRGHSDVTSPADRAGLWAPRNARLEYTPCFPVFPHDGALHGLVRRVEKIAGVEPPRHRRENRETQRKIDLVARLKDDVREREIASRVDALPDTIVQQGGARRAGSRRVRRAGV